MKYIVYKTTNKVNNYIYIGVHKTAYPNKFDGYLGCGVRINKPSTYEKGKTAFQIAVKTFGLSNFYRETLAIFDTEQDAYLLEELLVNEEFLARPDVYNMVLGGQVNRAKGRPVYEYDMETGKFIQEFPSAVAASIDADVTPNNISRAILSYYLVRGRCFSYIRADKIDTSPYINKQTAQPVYRYLISGEFDGEFSSLNSAAKAIDVSIGYIQKATIFGYRVKDSYYFSFCQEKSYDLAMTRQIQTRAVYRYDSEGNFSKEYSTQKEAELDNKKSNITKSIKTKTIDTNGWFWSLEKIPQFNVPIKKEGRKIAKFDNDGNIIQVWDSLPKCKKDVGVAVQNVLQGKYSKHKGFIYKYINIEMGVN